MGGAHNGHGVSDLEYGLKYVKDVVASKVCCSVIYQFRGVLTML